MLRDSRKQLLSCPYVLGTQLRASYIMVTWERSIKWVKEWMNDSGMQFVFIVAALPSLTFYAHRYTAPLRHPARHTNAGNRINPQPDTQLRNLRNRSSATAPGQTRGREKYKAICLSCGLPSSCCPPVPLPINKGCEGDREQRWGAAGWA